MEYQELNEDGPVLVGPPVVLEVGKEAVGFTDLGLNPQLIASVDKVGWKEPTPVQRMCLPVTLAGREIAAFAQTGTGKTGVFLMTIAQKILTKRALGDLSAKDNDAIKAVVMVPTRELAMQIVQDAQSLYGDLGISCLAVYGGENWDKQKSALDANVDLIVATPGRLKDYDSKGIADLSKCWIFVCDEVDRMFDMGFIEDVEHFLGKIPENCQKLFFSATTSEQVKELAFGYLDQPEYVTLVDEELTPDRIVQHAVICSAGDKLKVLLGLLREHKPVCSLIFANTKLVAEWLFYKLTRNGLEADIITGDLPQNKRTRLIKKIKDGEIKVLIATDVVSRGLHIAGVTHVYNFDIPEEAANYVHRIGRTARAGASGSAYSLICDDYGENFEQVRKLLGPNAPVATWFPDAYRDIVDEAPDPFAKENIVYDNERPEGRDYGRDGPRRGASSGSSAGHGGGRGAGYASGRGPEGEDRPRSKDGRRPDGRPGFNKGPRPSDGDRGQQARGRNDRHGGDRQNSDRQGNRGRGGDRYQQDRSRHDQGGGARRHEHRRVGHPQSAQEAGRYNQQSTRGQQKSESMTFKGLIKWIVNLFTGKRK